MPKLRGTVRADDLGLTVKNMSEMIRFYRDVLGFEIKEKEDAAQVYLIKIKYTKKPFPKESYPFGDKEPVISDNLIEIGSFNRPFER